MPKFLKTISQATPRSPIWYGECELSFEKTQVVHVKMHHPGSMQFHLPHIPCINPHVDCDTEFENDDQLCYRYDAGRQSFLENGGEEGPHFDEEEEGEENLKKSNALTQEQKSP
ncbi:hypothetical protein EUGRSUZ_A02768 [Eucalyptus grandis]|uniref:Uncharacterized protein n=2 Tax=Eucalyptus grandis TaxID=71139 RepID=A0ACC3M7G9_EUCGR|nr:hypothetical protein EUGRSUZ_A02768 [Eucalyptus grandis]